MSVEPKRRTLLQLCLSAAHFLAAGADKARRTSAPLPDPPRSNITRSCGSRRLNRAFRANRLSSRNRPRWLADVSTRITKSCDSAPIWDEPAASRSTQNTTRRSPCRRSPTEPRRYRQADQTPDRVNKSPLIRMKTGSNKRLRLDIVATPTTEVSFERDLSPSRTGKARLADKKSA